MLWALKQDIHFVVCHLQNGIRNVHHIKLIFVLGDIVSAIDRAKALIIDHCRFFWLWSGEWAWSAIPETILCQSGGHDPIAIKFRPDASGVSLNFGHMAHLVWPLMYQGLDRGLIIRWLLLIPSQCCVLSKFSFLTLTLLKVIVSTRVSLGPGCQTSGLVLLAFYAKAGSEEPRVVCC